MTLPVPQPEPAPDSGSSRRDSDPTVHRITSAQTPLSQQQTARQKRYLISMGIRTVCFLGMVFTDGWLRWALLAGAVVLPYVAVVMANAGRENDMETGPTTVTPIDLPTIEGTRPGIGS